MGKGATSEAGNISSELLMRSGGVRSIFLLPLMARCLDTIDVCIWRMLASMCAVLTVWGLWELLPCSGRRRRQWVPRALECLGMLHACARDVMDVVPSVCTVRRRAAGARAWDV